MWRGISLANKVLLLFGLAVVLIVVAALSVPWLRMYSLVDDGQLQVSRALVDAWERVEMQLGSPRDPRAGPSMVVEHAGIKARRVSLAGAEEEGKGNPFLRRAARALQADPGRGDYQRPSWNRLVREYRYARAIRAERPAREGAGGGGGGGGGGRTGEEAGGAEGELVGMVVMQRQSSEAARLIVVNTVYIISAGAAVLGLAVLVFYLITHQIILSPVRSLKETAERVREGDLSIRSEIHTGDEFEELAATFNSMVVELVRSQDQLKAINSALDVKLSELAEANLALFEAAKLKGDFLANVSHELRTPLNSIIGFAELLREGAVSEQEAGDDSSRLGKRIRYLENIITASRGLLDMINSLLEMARIEAGKVQLNPAPLNLREACQGVLGLIAPLAERKGLELRLEAAEDLPVVETDAKKLQQIVFNFLSNAVKFTPAADGAGKAGRVTLRAEHLPGRGPEGPGAADRVRISVIDTGPGIAPEDQARLFQKFTQLDGGHTREHTGTGLGLAISKELAGVMQGEIQLVSEMGRGSMFSLILPVRPDPGRVEEQKLESAFRGKLAERRAWAVG